MANQSNFEYDVNIIHADFDYSNDNEEWKELENFLEFLVEQLETNYKLKCYFPSRDLLGGRNIFNETFRVLQSSKYTLVIVSPHFLKSEWSKYQQQVAQLDLLGKDTFVPIAIPGVKKEDMPRDMCLPAPCIFTKENWNKIHDRAWRNLFKLLGKKDPVQRQGSDSERCAICQQTLSCGHVYHPPCVKEAHEHGISTCPQCRKPFADSSSEPELIFSLDIVEKLSVLLDGIKQEHDIYALISTMQFDSDSDSDITTELRRSGQPTLDLIKTFSKKDGFDKFELIKSLSLIQRFDAAGVVVKDMEKSELKDRIVALLHAQENRPKDKDKDKFFSYAMLALAVLLTPKLMEELMKQLPQEIPGNVAVDQKFQCVQVLLEQKVFEKGNLSVLWNFRSKEEWKIVTNEIFPETKFYKIPNGGCYQDSGQEKVSRELLKKHMDVIMLRNYQTGIEYRKKEMYKRAFDNLLLHEATPVYLNGRCLGYVSRDNTGVSWQTVGENPEVINSVDEFLSCCSSFIQDGKTELYYRVKIKEKYAFVSESELTIELLKECANRFTKKHKIKAAIPYIVDGQTAVALYMWKVKGIPDTVKPDKDLTVEFMGFPCILIDLSRARNTPRVKDLPSIAWNDQNRSDMIKAKDDLTKELVMKHCNIASISIGPKVIQYKTDDKDEKLYFKISVLTKGLIPLGEEMLMTHSPDYGIDVIEGCCNSLSGSLTNLLCRRTSPLFPGLQIAMKDGDNAGTLGTFVKKHNDQGIYLISCEHVLDQQHVAVEQPGRKFYDVEMTDSKDYIQLMNKPHYSESDISEKKHLEELKKGPPKQVATVVYGIKENIDVTRLCPEARLYDDQLAYVDVALAKLVEDEQWGLSVPPRVWKEYKDGRVKIKAEPYSMREFHTKILTSLISGDASQYVYLYKIGYKTGVTQGIVHTEMANDRSTHLHLLSYDNARRYNQDREQFFEDWRFNVMHIKSTSEDKFCDHGDSGALVFDGNGKAVGLLFGDHEEAGKRMGAATPIEIVLRKLEANLAVSSFPIDSHRESISTRLRVNGSNVCRTLFHASIMYLSDHFC